MMNRRFNSIFLLNFVICQLVSGAYKEYLNFVSVCRRKTSIVWSMFQEPYFVFIISLRMKALVQVTKTSE